MKTLRRLAIFVLMVMPPAFSSGRVAAAEANPSSPAPSRFSCWSADRRSSTPIGRSSGCRSRRRRSPTRWSPRLARCSCTARRRARSRCSCGADNGRITNYEVIVPPRLVAARRANPQTVPERADCRCRQRQGRRAVGCRLGEVRHRPRKGAGRRLRRQAGKHRQHDAPAGEHRHRPGDAEACGSPK